MGCDERREERREAVFDRLAGDSVSDDDHEASRPAYPKKSPNRRVNLQEGGFHGGTMGKAIGTMTAVVGTYMTFKMWAEFNEALGTVFGASWAIIISTLVFLIYQSNKNDKMYEANFGKSSPEQSAIIKQMEAENAPPFLFVAGCYVFILVVFEILLATV
jgi:hypothetical protein